MLKIEIINVENRFVWVFDSADKHACAKSALADLVANDGFWADNEICTEFPDYFTPDENVVGMLRMPADEIDDAIDDDGTYWIIAEEYVVGTIVSRYRN